MFCEDFFEHTRQVIHRRQIIGYGNSTNSVAVDVILCAPPSNSRYQRNPRSKNFGCGGAALVIHGPIKSRSRATPRSRVFQFSAFQMLVFPMCVRFRQTIQEERLFS